MPMISFLATIKKFAEKGEKTGWTYIDVSSKLATKLLPGNKKSFRVKGKLDQYSFEGLALLPMGHGDFILVLNATIRKAIKKKHGASVEVKLEVDKKEKVVSEDFLLCLEDDPGAIQFFKSLTKSHQHYFSNWIESAKTEITKAKRIAQATNALAMGLGYSEMIRMHKKLKE